MSGKAHKRALAIAVVEGGASDEREVSLNTGSAVRAALTANGHKVLRVELKDDGLTWQTSAFKAGAAAAFAGPLAAVDVVFLALHGGIGEGGALQGLLQSLGVAHTGSGLAASALALDKLASLRMLAAEGLCTPKRQVLESAAAGSIERRAALAFGQKSGGLVVKPRWGGSSVATFMLAGERLSRSSLDAALGVIFRLPDDALVEAFTQGLEVTCGVLEDESGQPFALPIVEIHPKQDRFFDYEEKYNENGAREVCPPGRLTASQITAVEKAALLAHRVIGAKGYSRSDFILRASVPDSPVFLEINTLPGLTIRSLLPLSASQAGLDFKQLCERIVRVALL